MAGAGLPWADRGRSKKGRAAAGTALPVNGCCAAKTVLPPWQGSGLSSARLAHAGKLVHGAESRANRVVRGVHVRDHRHHDLVDGVGDLLYPLRRHRCPNRLLRYHPPCSGRQPPIHLQGHVLLTLCDD
jgi:hypothetical protein